MAKLTVEAVANEALSDKIMDLLVSVIDDAGVPVTGLSAANFKVGSPMRELLETPVVTNTYDLSAVALPGSYEVQIELSQGQAWVAQIYPLVLAVARTRHSQGIVLPILDQGQTVLRLEIP